MPASSDQLHEHALQAEKHAEALATGLGQVGAPDEIIQAVGKMADTFRQLASKLVQQVKEEPAPPVPSTDEAISEHMAQRRAAVAPPE